MTTISPPRKLIEFGLPLEGLNEHCIREKKISKGHPSTLHYWWAPRPLAAIRAVIFATLVNDPSAEPDRFPAAADQEAERERLFDLIVRMADWDNRNDERLWREVREAITASNPGGIPPILDPFCGRGTIPFEAQRMDLQGISSDLNPIPATIARALGTIPALARDKGAINPDAKEPIGGWKGVAGLVSDLKYYAARAEAHARRTVGSLFDDVLIDEAAVALAADLKRFKGQSFTPLGWLWAKTATCSNPACGRPIPLLGQMWLCKRKGNKSRPAFNLWIEPRVREDGSLDLAFVSGSSGPDFTFKGTRATFFRCGCCGEATARKVIEAEATGKGLGVRLIGAVVDGPDTKLYVPATEAMRRDVDPGRSPDWRCELPVPDYSQALPGPIHGVRVWGDFFTDRQTIMLDAFAEGIRSALGEATDACTKACESERVDSLATILALCVGKLVNRNNAFCFWETSYQKIQQPFLQQGIQKTWDYCETNPFAGKSGSWKSCVDYPVAVLENSPQVGPPVEVHCQDVRQAASSCERVVVVTDPPYYANMGYADLSDIFYIWIRRTLERSNRDCFGTLLTPKTEELAANAHRFDGDKDAAEKYFIDGFEAAFKTLASIHDPRFPFPFFYAYKQQEKKGDGDTYSTGWDTLLEGLVRAGLMVTATWPVRTEDISAIKKQKSSLATSIVLACRPRPVEAPTTTRTRFLDELKEAIRAAVEELQSMSITAADMAQAIIGPGMAVYTKYREILDSNDEAVSVRDAIIDINREYTEIRMEGGDLLDDITQTALEWFDSYGFEPGPAGIFDQIATAKNVDKEKALRSGVFRAKGNSMQLIPIAELDGDWTPEEDDLLTAWEVVHHLIRSLDSEGVDAAAIILRRSGEFGEAAKTLAYHLFEVAEKKQWAEEKLAYTQLTGSWAALEDAEAMLTETLEAG